MQVTSPAPASAPAGNTPTNPALTIERQMERNSLPIIPIMSPVKLVGVSHSHSHPARQQPRATTLDRIDVVTQIGSTRLKRLHAIVERLAARGETPAAFGRRCIPADFVAPPSNIPDIAP